jgi:hypothetical protein
VKQRQQAAAAAGAARRERHTGTRHHMTMMWGPIRARRGGTAAATTPSKSQARPGPTLSDPYWARCQLPHGRPRRPFPPLQSQQRRDPAPWRLGLWREASLNFHAWKLLIGRRSLPFSSVKIFNPAFLICIWLCCSQVDPQTFTNPTLVEP